MLCLGGPKHGEDVNCKKPWFEVAVPKRVYVWDYTADPPIEREPYRVVRYDRHVVVTKSGKQIPVWVVE